MYDCSLVITECSDDLRERWEKVRVLGELICRTLANEVNKIGLSEKALTTAAWERARFELQRDPATDQSSLAGIWRDTRGQRVGSIIFHCDGSFFAEYDVVERHPKDPRWFVESVIAWGKHDTIKAEPRLLPAVL
jgi:hypothetical protein